MAEQEAVEVPAEMDEYQAAEAMAKAGLFAEPTEEPTRKLPPKDPATGKFMKAAPPVEGDEEGAEPEAEAEEQPEVETPEEKEVRLLKVKLDGMEQELPEEEVTKGYLRQADYTRKTQELAETRKRFEAEEIAPVREEREYYRTRIEALEEALEALAPSKEPDWEALAKELPPEDFGHRFQAWKKGQDQKGRIREEHARIRALQEQDEVRARATRLRQEQERLEAAIPELKDPEKGKVLREDLTAFAKSLGFSDDDLANIEDHRALVILNESRLYRESQKRRPTVEAKLEKAIAGIKPAGAPAKSQPKVAAQAKARFLQTGSVEDAAEAMRAAKLFG